MKPNYTFMSRSTAKPGRLEDLIRITSAPPKTMAETLDAPILYQVSVDRSRNSVVVWTTLSDKDTLYNYLATPAGQSGHGDPQEMEEIIETFEMFDLTPVGQNIEI